MRTRNVEERAKDGVRRAEGGVQMSNLNARDPPELAEATTNRSRCQSCGETIAQGSHRIGMVGRSSGISCRKWMHPSCFAQNMKVDYAPTGRAKCNADPDGPLINKGEPRFLLRMMKESCSGDVVPKCQQIYRPTNASALVSKFLSLDGVAVTPESIDGLEELECDEHRKWVVDALRGMDVSSQPIPVASAVSNAPARKPRPKKKKGEEEGEGGAGAPGDDPPAKRTKAGAKQKKAAAAEMHEAEGESSTEEID